MSLPSPRRLLRAVVALQAALVLMTVGLVAGPMAAGATPPPDAVLRTVASADRPTTVSMPDFRLAPLRPTPRPVRLRIPAIDVATDLDALGLRADRRIEVPDDPHQAGWYRHRAVPGEPGAGVIVGHVDSHTGPAVFFELRLLAVGDHVTVARDDGSVAVFEIVSVETHRKDRFPTHRVYGPIDGQRLRIVTCGGAFDERQRSYEDNVVVFADLLMIL